MARRGATIGLVPIVGPLGARTLAGGSGEVGNDDFRDVPASDSGNAGYDDRGMLGSYGPSDREAFRDPAGVRHFSGYGCDEATYERGFADPAIRENPAYDLTAYKDRYSAPMEADEDMGETQRMSDDWAFRDRARRSRGFLTRPRIPTERS